MVEDDAEEEVAGTLPQLYRAQPCPCGRRDCADWHVWPVAAIVGVKFTEVQARAVATMLNWMALVDSRSVS